MFCMHLPSNKSIYTMDQCSPISILSTGVYSLLSYSFRCFVDLYGATEIAGVDKSARSKLQGWKTRELTTWHEV